MTQPIIYALIGARGGSKGVPGKNIKRLANKPLLAYSVQACKRSRLIERTVLSTDSEEIAAVGREFGAEAPFFRPAEISGDASVDYEWIDHALGWFKKSEGRLPHFLVHIRPTTPLRDPEIVDEAIKLMLRSPSATALRSVHQMSESAYKMFEIEGGLCKRVGSDSLELDAANVSRQAMPKTYVPNGYVDVLRTSFIREQKKIHGNRVIPFLTPRVDEVDTQEDFDLLEYTLSKRQDIFDKLFA
jgi:N-acylneuraminate cytidylyltransferase